MIWNGFVQILSQVLKVPKTTVQPCVESGVRQSIFNFTQRADFICQEPREDRYVVGLLLVR
jgi:hypothetical protein